MRDLVMLLGLTLPHLTSIRRVYLYYPLSLVNHNYATNIKPLQHNNNTTLYLYTR